MGAISEAVTVSDTGAVEAIATQAYVDDAIAALDNLEQEEF